MVFPTAESSDTAAGRKWWLLVLFREPQFIKIGGQTTADFHSSGKVHVYKTTAARSLLLKKKIKRPRAIFVLEELRGRKLLFSRGKVGLFNFMKLKFERIWKEVIVVRKHTTSKSETEL